MAEYINLDTPLEAYRLRGNQREPISTTLRVLLDFNNIPYTADDVQPVRHGRWWHRWVCSNMTGYEYACSCSECGKPTYRTSTLEPMPPYCPNCGAKMDGDVNGGTDNR